MIAMIRRTSWSHLRRLKPNHARSSYRCMCSTGDKTGSEDDIDFTKRIRNLPESERFGSYAQKFSVSTEKVNIREKMSNLDEAEIEEEQKIEDIESHTRLTPIHGPKDRTYFVRKINKFITAGEYDNAKDVLYTEMFQEYRVKPTTHICNRIFSVHSRLGEAVEARELMQMMLKHRILPDNLSFGLMFSAYAHTNDREFAKTAAEKLYDYLRRQEIPLNYEVYSRVIMCFSRSGNIHYMMRALDDMFMLAKFRPDDRILHYVLEGCRTDKECGAGMALEVWNRFRKMRKITLSQKHYNLLLKCVCECRLGDVKQLITTFSERTENFDYMSLIADDDDELSSVESVSDVTTSSPNGDLKFSESHIDSSPVNLISRESFTGSPSELHHYLKECSEQPPKNNICVIGGIEGLMKTLESEGLDINLHIITTLLNIFGEDKEFENYMLGLAESKGLEKDIALYNQLITNSTTTEEKDKIIEELTAKNMRPDIVTLGAYSKGVYNVRNIRMNLDNLAKNGHTPTIFLFRQWYRSSKANFHAKRFLLRMMTEYDVYPDREMIEMIEDDINLFRELWLRFEDGEKVPEAVCTEHVRFAYLNFISSYRSWLKTMALETTET